MSHDYDLQQVYIEYHSYERLYRRLRTIYGLIIALCLVAIALLINYVIPFATGQVYNVVITVACLVLIVGGLAYTVIRAYLKAVSIHEMYRHRMIELKKKMMEHD